MLEKAKENFDPFSDKDIIISLPESAFYETDSFSENFLRSDPPEPRKESGKVPPALRDSKEEKGQGAPSSREWRNPSQERTTQRKGGYNGQVDIRFDFFFNQTF